MADATNYGKRIDCLRVHMAEPPFVALSRSNDAYINIRPETLSRCKQVRESYICQNTEPERTITEQVTCEITIATGLRIPNLATCDVRVVKLETTFWARTSSANSWMFSTNKKDKLTVTCPRVAEKVIVIQGVELLELAAGCSGARTLYGSSLVAVTSGFRAKIQLVFPNETIQF